MHTRYAWYYHVFVIICISFHLLHHNLFSYNKECSNWKAYDQKFIKAPKSRTPFQTRPQDNNFGLMVWHFIKEMRFNTIILRKDAIRKINYLLLEYQTHNLEITIKCRLYTNLLAWNVHKSTYRYYLISCQHFIDSQIKIYWNTVCYALSNRVLSTMPFALLILKILTKIGAIRIIFREIFSARGILICKCDRHVRSHADLPNNQGFLLVERRETLCARVA